VQLHNLAPVAELTRLLHVVKAATLRDADQL
jgi:hypothetical protein